MNLVEQIASLRRTFRRLISQRLGKHTNRPLTQLLLLKFVDEGSARSQADLAERLVIDAPAVSRLVDRLAEDGLVKRSVGDNRRCVRLETTPAGREELQILRRALVEVEGEVGQFLTPPELESLKHLLEKVYVGLVRTNGLPPPSDGCGGD